MLRLSSEQPLARLPQMLLVHNAERLPLSPDPSQGSLVHRFTFETAVPERTEIDIEEFEMPRGPGWVRLFMDVPQGFPVDVALLDPLVEQLEC
jgi:hypothetical protein